MTEKKSPTTEAVTRPEYLAASLEETDACGSLDLLVFGRNLFNGRFDFLETVL